MKKIILFLFCFLISVSSLADYPYFSFSENCPEDKPFEAHFGGCQGCNELKFMHIEKGHEADFERCLNRETIETKWGFSYSRLKKCPDSAPLRDHLDGCVSCEEPEFIFIKNEADCSICPNRKVENYHGSSITCIMNECPDNFPLRDDGACLACKSPYWTTDDKGTCEKCSNRQYIPRGIILSEKRNGLDVNNTESWGKTTVSGCYLKVKDENKPLFRVAIQEIMTFCYDCGFHGEKYQKFYSCNEKNPIITLPEICAKCPNRDYVNGECILRECMEGTIKDEKGLSFYCTDCDSSDKIDTDIEECHKCPNRLWGGKSGTLADYCFSCEYFSFLYTTAEECARCSDSTYDSEKGICKKKEVKEMLFTPPDFTFK